MEPTRMVEQEEVNQQAISASFQRQDDFQHNEAHQSNKESDPIQCCPICNCMFFDQQSLSRHMQCCRELNSNISASVHIQDVLQSGQAHQLCVLPNPTYYCPQCKQYFLDVNSLRMHTHHHTETNVPHTISANVQRQSVLQSYEAQRLSECLSNPFKCLYCEHEFKECVDLRKHMQDNHPQEKNHYKCYECNMSFSTPSLLVIHEATHYSEESYVCRICEDTFTTYHKLYRHKVLVHRKQFTCTFQECNKNFSSSHNLKEHVATHYSEKPYMCDICKKTFKIKSYLMKHKVNIHGKQFECNICGRRFGVKHRLRTHIKQCHLS